MTQETEIPEVTEDGQTTLSVTSETMLGDIVSTIIDEIKAAPDVWQKLSEDQQDAMIERVTSRSEELVRQAVKLIASDGREVITAELEQITAKDGIKAVCTLAKYDPNRHALLDSVGKAVLIVVADANQFMGGEKPRADPQQPQLPGTGADDSSDPPVADNCPATAAEAA